MRTQELIVEYIRDNPGCIKRMYREQDQDHIDESVLLNPEDWKLLDSDGVELREEDHPQDESQWWENSNDKVLSGWWVLPDGGRNIEGAALRGEDTKWVDNPTGYADGIVFVIEERGKDWGPPYLSDGRCFSKQES